MVLISAISFRFTQLNYCRDKRDGTRKYIRTRDNKIKYCEKEDTRYAHYKMNIHRDPQEKRK